MPFVLMLHLKKSASIGALKWPSNQQTDQQLKGGITFCVGVAARVSDPVWYWPYQDPTSQDKPDPDPDTSVFHQFYDEF